MLFLIHGVVCPYANVAYLPASEMSGPDDLNIRVGLGEREQNILS